MRQLLPAVLLLTACATTPPGTDDPPAPDVDVITDDLERELGGFDTSDEAPLFAEDELFDAADIEADTAVTDALATTDAALADMDRPDNATVAGRHLIVMWGRMPADRDFDRPRVWDGALRISRGGLIVRRTIAFEDRTDELLPRTSRDTVAFRSTTGPRSDGLALTVYDPSPATTDAIALTYTSRDGVATFRFDLRELDNGPIVVDAGDGNKMIVASRHRRDRCDHGFLRGRWHALNPNAGYFRGLVLNAHGEPAGHVRGIYGERRDGSSVLFGKFINREGGFRGLLKGTYGDGKFNARWIDRGGDHGVAHGVYFPGATLRAGGFLGRWAETSCAGG